MATFVVAHGAWSSGWAWKKMHPPAGTLFAHHDRDGSRLFLDLGSDRLRQCRGHGHGRLRTRLHRPPPPAARLLARTGSLMTTRAITRRVRLAIAGLGAWAALAFIGGFFGGTMAFWFMFGPIIGSTIFLMIYSYALYQRELKA